MSKPWGMTAGFQIVRPTQAQNAIYEAVREAQAEGMTVREFMQEARECWKIHTEKRVKDDDKEWSTP